MRRLRVGRDGQSGRRSRNLGEQLRRLEALHHLGRAVQLERLSAREQSEEGDGLHVETW